MTVRGISRIESSASMYVEEAVLGVVVYVEHHSVLEILSTATLDQYD
jgi:hypothetical protein